ncbi:hypothetical protein MRX96_057591 [Rhipicephalus microplus]
MYQACVALASSNRMETKYLLDWLLSLNLDFFNETRLATVNPVEMMVRGSLDLGVQAVVAITFSELELVNSKRKIQIEYSSEQKTWFAKSRRIQDYESILSNYGVTPRFVNQLALKISEYDMHLVPPRMIYQTKRMAYRIRSAFEKALNSSNWIGRDIRDELINKLIDVTFYVGSQGRRSDPAFVEEVYREFSSK